MLEKLKDSKYDRLHREVVQHLQKLVQFDTSNPPGNELPAAEYIADVLASESIDVQVLKTGPNRGNTIARLKGDGSKPPILLMSHIDVVPAERERWKHAPFSGDITDGYLWGRETVDTKQLTAMEMVVMLELKRRGIRLKRDVILAATADEERGNEFGMKWLVENRPELIKAEYAINEGGGVGLEVGKHMLFTVQTGERGFFMAQAQSTGALRSRQHAYGQKCGR